MCLQMHLQVKNITSFLSGVEESASGATETSSVFGTCLSLNLSSRLTRFGAPKTIVCAQKADFCEEVSCGSPRLMVELWVKLLWFAGEPAAAGQVEGASEGFSSGAAAAQPSARLHGPAAEGGAGADGGRETGRLGRLPRPRPLPVQDHRQPHHQVQPLLSHAQPKGQLSQRGEDCCHADDDLCLFWIVNIFLFADDVESAEL